MGPALGGGTSKKLWDSKGQGKKGKKKNQQKRGGETVPASSYAIPKRLRGYSGMGKKGSQICSQEKSKSKEGFIRQGEGGIEGHSTKLSPVIG